MTKDTKKSNMSKEEAEKLASGATALSESMGKEVAKKEEASVALTQVQEYDSNIGNEDLILPRV